jgi:hypothetical protein
VIPGKDWKMCFGGEIAVLVETSLGVFLGIFMCNAPTKGVELPKSVAAVRPGVISSCI